MIFLTRDVLTVRSLRGDELSLSVRYALVTCVAKGCGGGGRFGLVPSFHAIGHCRNVSVPTNKMHLAKSRASNTLRQYLGTVVL